MVWLVSENSQGTNNHSQQESFIGSGRLMVSSEDSRGEDILFTSSGLQRDVKFGLPLLGSDIPSILDVEN